MIDQMMDQAFPRIGLGMERYGAYISNNHLLKDQRSPAPGVLDALSLNINELKGKKVLDICIGQGNTILEGHQLGVDIYGIDLVPAFNPTPEERIASPQVAELIDKARLKLIDINSKYPGKIFAADGTSSLPFKDDFFDISYSHLGLPGYARSPEEAVNSLLEMIRVSKEKVAINPVWEDLHNKRDYLVCKSANGKFKFRLQDFLKSLDKYGVKFEPQIERFSGWETIESNIHIDCTRKNLAQLKIDHNAIIAQAKKYFKTD